MIVNGNTLLTEAPLDTMYLSKMKANGVSHGLSEAGYDIRIKQDVTFHPRTRLDPLGSVHMIDPDNPISHSIEEGLFTLASVIERFDMPPNMAAVVHDKSTWARCGLSVFNTVIEPGWRGSLTLELVYHGNKPLHIPRGSGIAQVIFHRVTCPMTYDGKYQDQQDRPVPAIFTKS